MLSALSWILPILAGAGDALSRLPMKMTTLPSTAFVGVGYLVWGVPIFGLLLWWQGIPEIRTTFWIAVALHVPLMLAASLMTVTAHRQSPFVLTTPYLALTPAFLLITAPIMGGGTPTPLGGLGVLILTAGIYLLNTKGEKLDLWEPIRRLKREEGSRLMLGVAAIFAIAANLDLWAITNGSIPLYLFVDSLLVGIISLLLAAKLHGEKMWGMIAANHSPIGFFGVTNALSLIAQMSALALLPVVPYVIAGKRAGLILFSMMQGLYLGRAKRFGGQYKDEVESLAFRIPAILVIVCGMVLIIFWGTSPS